MLGGEPSVNEAPGAGTRLLLEDADRSHRPTGHATALPPHRQRARLRRGLPEVEGGRHLVDVAGPQRSSHQRLNTGLQPNHLLLVLQRGLGSRDQQCRGKAELSECTGHRGRPPPDVTRRGVGSQEDLRRDGRGVSEGGKDFHSDMHRRASRCFSICHYLLHRQIEVPHEGPAHDSTLRNRRVCPSYLCERNGRTAMYSAILVQRSDNEATHLRSDWMNREKSCFRCQEA
mmetsp:Transcript_165471/g.530959  ORF Transcript_165471/g.530959 Transcript_165471/m.530959 type:complete len:230 (+) Transcript_165471:1262-1951(+)